VEVGSVVDVVETEKFDALVARVAALEGQIKVMPQDVKDKLIAVLEWLKANV
jgi:hypothetical protein